jgi:hypothetical protein
MRRTLVVGAGIGEGGTIVGDAKGASDGMGVDTESTLHAGRKVSASKNANVNCFLILMKNTLLA